jgi:non-heme chloroperoxidase
MKPSPVMHALIVNDFQTALGKDNMQRKTFRTSDGAELSYISAGSGQPIMMLHAWSQSAEQFKYQIPVFAEHYQVIAVDLRGHGESEKVPFGYRILWRIACSDPGKADTSPRHLTPGARRNIKQS